MLWNRIIDEMRKNIPWAPIRVRVITVFLFFYSLGLLSLSSSPMHIRIQELSGISSFEKSRRNVTMRYTTQPKVGNVAGIKYLARKHQDMEFRGAWINIDVQRRVMIGDAHLHSRKFRG